MGKRTTSISKKAFMTIFGSAFAFLLFAPNAEAQRSFPGDFEPGDGVRIITWQSPVNKSNVGDLGISNDYIIDRRGRIFLPLIGDMRVVGLTREALQDSLEVRYRKYASGLSFVCKPLIRIAVLGVVNKPGTYVIEPTESLWSVIDLAGGPLTGADFEKIYYVRNGEVVAENLLAQFERAYSIQEIGMRSGDQLYIPGKSTFSIRTVFQYTSFLTSLVVLYFTIEDRRNR